MEIYPTITLFLLGWSLKKKRNLYDLFLWMGFSWCSFNRCRKAELTLELPSGFEPRTPGLGIQRLNHYAIAPLSFSVGLSILSSDLLCWDSFSFVTTFLALPLLVLLLYLIMLAAAFIITSIF